MSNERLTINGIEIEVIECFAEQVLVQEAISKKIYLIYYNQIDQGGDCQYNDGEMSNVVSMHGWKQWRMKKRPTLCRVRPNNVAVILAFQAI